MPDTEANRKLKETSPADSLSVFIRLYIEEYGITLTPPQAEAELAKLKQLYRVIYLQDRHGL